MKINRDSQSKLVITVSDKGFEMVWLMCAVGFGLFAAYQSFRYPSFIYRESFQGSVAAMVVGILGYAVVYERARFEFDRVVRTLKWSRWRMTGARSGTVSFNDITYISNKTSVGSNKINPSRRVAINTATQEIPLTVAYAPDPSGQNVKIVDEIRAFVGL